MIHSAEAADLAIVGGGYYGAALAIQQRTTHPDWSIVLLEREAQLFSRASSSNQGQLHAGYMYPGFPALAADCAVEAAAFAELYPEAINGDVTTYYGVHQGSALSTEAYRAFCAENNLPLVPAATAPEAFRGPAVAALYETAEKTFSNRRLQDRLLEDLTQGKIEIRTGSEVTRITPTDGGLRLETVEGGAVAARRVCLAAFADTNALLERSHFESLPLEHAVYLHFLVRLPELYRQLGLIVVQGPYGALVPTEDHPGATHIFASAEQRVLKSGKGVAPSEAVEDSIVAERFSAACQAVRAFMPAIAEAELTGYTVGTRSNYIDPLTEIAASRAVLVKDYAGISNFHLLVGGKVSCLPEVRKFVL